MTKLFTVIKTMYYDFFFIILLLGVHNTIKVYILESCLGFLFLVFEKLFKFSIHLLTTSTNVHVSTGNLI